MNIINLETRKREFVYVAEVTYTIFSHKKGGKLICLELEVGKDTTYTLMPSDSPDSLFAAVPKTVEDKLRELLS